jgi:filamentous hemagglutinin family protein
MRFLLIKALANPNDIQALPNCRVLLCLFTLFGMPLAPVMAQVTPDASLNTIVNSLNNRDFTISNGQTVGRNLFHSFEQFSIPGDGSANFDHALGIQNIFARVTGTNASQIDGLIRSRGSANLFLLNPQGIAFGNQARLAIGGSFFGTTANSIQFEDGAIFPATAVPANRPPLLTLSTPIGLQFGGNSGPIQLNGAGHTLITENPVVSTILPTQIDQGLSVQPGKTIALLGNGLSLRGGIIAAPGGRVELGSITSGQVRLTPEGAAISYATANATTNAAEPQFGDIQLTAQSLVEANGPQSGAIQVRGHNITVADGSVILLQNRGPAASAGNIDLNATGAVNVRGTSPDDRISSTITTEGIGPGRNGLINLTAPEVTIAAGALIGSKSYVGAGGDVNINATKLQISGYAPNQSFIYSRIGSLAFGLQPAGNMTIATQNLTVDNGGYVGSTTLGQGSSGNVVVNAETISVDGFSPQLFPSLITSTTVGRGGNAGTLTINTRTLSLTNQGVLSTSSIGVGSAGDITVNATESIAISGGRQANTYGSGIVSTIDYPNSSYQQSLGLVNVMPIGSSGNITIRTPTLQLSDGGGIGSSNFAQGNGGSTNIIATTIKLNHGEIGVAALAGSGGNINIQADRLLLRQGALLEANAGAAGDGGNIMINANVILGWENSDIIANASQGRGGNIDINTPSLVGLKFQSQRTPDNDITASSEQGMTGSVQITTPNANPNNGLVALPINLVDNTQAISDRCQSSAGSSLVITGRGGLPPNPTTEPINHHQTWPDVRHQAIAAPRSQPPTIVAASTLPSPIAATIEAATIEATGWRKTTSGQVELIATIGPTPTPMRATCALKSGI